jgi:glycosyltransferase involved in cell wall biosynthesis
VATPLGSNPEMIEHGVTGFLADSEAEWIMYLKQLIEDHELRLSMSRKAVEAAKDTYSLEGNAEKIIAAFRGAMN